MKLNVTLTSYESQGYSLKSISNDRDDAQSH